MIRYYNWRDIFIFIQSEVLYTVADKISGQYIFIYVFILI